MKKIILLSAAALLAGLLLDSCQKKETPVTPSSVSNLRYKERPGSIALFWDMPADNTIRYIKVMYHDHLLDIDEVRLSSCDSILIPDTRAKFGDYNFTVQPFSSTDTGGESISITARSGAAPASFGQESKVELKVDDLSTNAQEPTEGPIENLLDGNTGTFFHTAWSQNIPGPHWLQIRLPNEIQGFVRFSYSPRNNDRQKPTDFDLMGSEDGNEWKLIKNFNKEQDGLPVTKTDSYTSPKIRMPFKAKHLRIVVNKTNTNDVFFTMSEFSLSSGPMIDPEAD